MSDYLSITSAQAFRLCPRLYFYGQELRYERIKREEADTRRVGSVFHNGLESWWTHAGKGDSPWLKQEEQDLPLVHALAAIDAAGKRFKADPYELAFSNALMIAYHAKYVELEFTFLGAEEWFRVDLMDPDGKPVSGWVFGGKKDARAEFPDQRRIVEHKTTSADISPGTPYWEKLTVDGQATAYIDSARISGEPIREIWWDAVRKPDAAPRLATPEADRKYTQGTGCKLCGGKVKVAGVGFIMTPGEGEAPPVKTECPDCAGTGWKQPPALYANQRAEDEPVLDYQQRILETLAAAPDQYMRQAAVPRGDAELAEARADLVSITCEIDGMRKRSRQYQGDLVRRGFPRNTSSCLAYGRRCDFLDVCSGQGRLEDETLYRIRPRGGQRNATK